MGFFSKIYFKMLQWAGHPRGPYYLGGISFMESSIFPIPPDFMLAPMVLARPNIAWRLAFITTLFSVLGGILGYGIGFFAYDSFGKSFIDTMGYQSSYIWVEGAFEQWGLIIIFIAAFTPIPFKIFTIASGVAHMPLIIFLLWSSLGRGCRFFLITKLLTLFGKRFEKNILNWIDRFGWVVIGLLIVAWVFYQYFLPFVR